MFIQSSNWQEHLLIAGKEYKMGLPVQDSLTVS